MTLLEQSTADKATIATLTAQVASLPGFQSQIATLTTENTQLKADKATLETNLTAANAATVAAVEKGKIDLTAAVAAANAAKDLELDTKAAAKAALIVAGAGGAPVVTTAADKPGAKTEKPLTGLAKYQAAIAEDIKGASGK